jgi:hypothetical protein
MIERRCGERSGGSDWNGWKREGHRRNSEFVKGDGLELGDTGRGCVEVREQEESMWKILLTEKYLLWLSLLWGTVLCGGELLRR